MDFPLIYHRRRVIQIKLVSNFRLIIKHVLTHTLHYLPSMNKLIACLGASAVGLGALGAHTLALYLDKSSIESFKTAVFYHIIHTLALLAIRNYPHSSLTVWFWSIGIFLFSGSIYLLSTDTLMGVDLHFLGPITPVGGLFLIAGWLSLIVPSVNK